MIRVKVWVPAVDDTWVGLLVPVENERSIDEIVFKVWTLAASLTMPIPATHREWTLQTSDHFIIVASLGTNVLRDEDVLYVQQHPAAPPAIETTISTAANVNAKQSQNQNHDHRQNQRQSHKKAVDTVKEAKEVKRPPRLENVSIPVENPLPNPDKDYVAVDLDLIPPHEGAEVAFILDGDDVWQFAIVLSVDSDSRLLWLQPVFKEQEQLAMLMEQARDDRDGEQPLELPTIMPEEFGFDDFSRFAVKPGGFDMGTGDGENGTEEPAQPASTGFSLPMLLGGSRSAASHVRHEQGGERETSVGHNVVIDEDDDEEEIADQEEEDEEEDVKVKAPARKRRRRSRSRKYLQQSTSLASV